MYSFTNYLADITKLCWLKKTALITLWARSTIGAYLLISSTLEPSINELWCHFHDIIHKEIEVYVNDIIVKSKKEEDHLLHLKCLFEHLCFRLNLQKIIGILS